MKENKLDFIDSIWVDNARKYLEDIGVNIHEAEEMAQWALENDIEDLDNLPEEYLKAKKETEEEEQIIWEMYDRI